MEYGASAMPGIVTHMLTGCILSIVGRFYFINYFNYNHKTKKQYLLVITCLSFSFLPDISLGIYYTTHILPFKVLARYHTITHILFCPIAIGVLLMMRSDTKRKPLWAMGLWTIILHLSMDLLIHETKPLF